MRGIWMVVSTGALTMMSQVIAAADKLIVAPPAAWVAPVAVPVGDGTVDDAAVKLLLQDEQYDLQAGQQTRYFETVFKIQTPQGLSAGGIALSWNPDSQNATVHKLQVRRGGKVIDILSSGQSFTVVRRESNLENAVLDGVLTATIQPEGLQVGDVIDFSGSITMHDAALGKHIENIGVTWNGAPIARAHMRAQWPASVPIDIRASGGIVVPKPIEKSGMRSVEFSMDDVQPWSRPRDHPGASSTAVPSR